MHISIFTITSQIDGAITYVGYLEQSYNSLAVPAYEKLYKGVLCIIAEEDGDDLLKRLQLAFKEQQTSPFKKLLGYSPIFRYKVPEVKPKRQMKSKVKSEQPIVRRVKVKFTDASTV
jgi:hypothetical protein